MTTSANPVVDDEEEEERLRREAAREEDGEESSGRNAEQEAEWERKRLEFLTVGLIG